jgi:hypothetical protein
MLPHCKNNLYHITLGYLIALGARVGELDKAWLGCRQDTFRP